MDKDFVKKVICFYTGYEPEEIVDILIEPDPKVDECFAIRTTIEVGKKKKRRESMDWLITFYDPEYSVEDVACKCLEEAEFETWPPVSGELKFFL